MAKKKASDKKKYRIRFELGIGGVLAVGLVCFCIFLWMFFLGVWAGQTVLQPGAEIESSFAGLPAKLWQGKSPVETGISEAWKDKPSVAAEGQEADNSFFALQVAAFRDPNRARKAVLQWRARDYEAFYLAPETEDSTFYRVFVGRIETMNEANALVAKLEAAEQKKFFITLIPSNQKRYP